MMSKNKKQCPHCGNWYKRLNAHKCKEKNKIKEEKGYSRKIPSWIRENKIDVEDILFLIQKSVKDRNDKEKWKFYRQLGLRLNTLKGELVEEGVDISSIR